MLFDSWAGHVSPEVYSKLVWPKTAILLRKLKSLGKPIIYYPGQNAHHLATIDLDLIDVIHFDWRFELTRSFKELEGAQEKLCVQGSLEPHALFLKEHELRQVVRSLMDKMQKHRPKKHIFNVGHGLTQESPIESLEWVVDEIRKYKLS